MKRVWIAAFVILTMVSLGVAKQPKLIKATIEPAVASVGDTVKVTVEFSGKASDIREVSFLPREYAYEVSPYYMTKAEKTKKNVWVLIGPIPYEAEPGIYHLEISAYDKNGKEIITPKYKDQEFGRTGLIKLEIK